MKYFKFVNNNFMVFSDNNSLNTLKCSDFYDDTNVNYELLDTYRFIYVQLIDDGVLVNFECDTCYLLKLDNLQNQRKLYNFIKLLFKSYFIDSIDSLLCMIDKHFSAEFSKTHYLSIYINSDSIDTNCLVWCTDGDISPVLDWLKNTNLNAIVHYLRLDDNLIYRVKN
jgi:hypothetical protein